MGNAISDVCRLAILEIISHKPMGADEITAALESMGHKRSTTTVRHHLEVLKEAGAVQISKIVETRGTVMKYYSPTLQPFRLIMKQDIELVAGRLISDVSKKLGKIIMSILEDKKFSLIQVEKTNCTLCKSDHSKAALALMIIEAALANVVQSSEFRERSSGKQQR